MIAANSPACPGLRASLRSRRAYSGHGAAGEVVEAFGRFAVGGNVVVGLVVALILVVINFVVIIKGAPAAWPK